MYVQEFIFSPRSWTGPDGETLLVPKDEVIGVMISYLQSRGFCFGFSWDNILDADLKRRNDFRAEKSYMAKYSAKLIWNVSALNKDMPREDNPFVVLFGYGNSENNKDIGDMSNFLYKWKTACTAWRSCIRILISFFSLTTNGHNRAHASHIVHDMS